MTRRDNPEHDRMNDFFKSSGLEDRRVKNPHITADDIPEDVETAEFTAKIDAARAAHANLRLRGKNAAGAGGASSGGAPQWKVSDDPAVANLILGTPPSLEPW